MDFSVEQKDLYIWISLKPGEGGQQALADALFPFIQDQKRFFAFDFSAVNKLDFKSLSTLETGAKTALKAGRKLAFCGVNETIRAVLEVTDLLTNTVFFASEKDLADNLRKVVSASAAKGATAAGGGEKGAPSERARSGCLNSVILNLITIGIVVAGVIVALSMISRQGAAAAKRMDILEMKLEMKIDAVRADIDSLQGKIASQRQEEMLMHELDQSSKAVPEIKTKPRTK